MNPAHKNHHGEFPSGKSIPDWKLPRGVARTQWDYITSEFVANNYDRSVGTSPLFEQDFTFFRSECPNPGITLDLGCGTGRFADKLTNLGYSCVSIDLSQDMLAIARTKVRNLTNALFARANMVELNFIKDQSLDYAVCLFSSFGMILDPTHRHEMLAEVHRVLKNTGSLILHVHNLWSSIQHPSDLGWLLPDLMKRFWGGQDFGNKLMPTHQEIHGLTLHLFTLHEIRSLLLKSGFLIKTVEPLFISKPGFLGKVFPGWRRAHGFLLHAIKENEHPPHG